MDISGRCCPGSSWAWESAARTVGEDISGPYFLGSSWVAARCCTSGPCCLGSTAVRQEVEGTWGHDYQGSSLGAAELAVVAAGTLDRSYLGSS